MLSDDTHILHKIKCVRFSYKISIPKYFLFQLLVCFLKFFRNKKLSGISIKKFYCKFPINQNNNCFFYSSTKLYDFENIKAPQRFAKLYESFNYKSSYFFFRSKKSNFCEKNFIGSNRFFKKFQGKSFFFVEVLNVTSGSSALILLIKII